jgi:hypothetical protein
LDGVDPDALDAVIPPPSVITVADLDDAIHQAAATIRFTTAPHPGRARGWVIAWGDQVDVRVIAMRGGNSVTDAMVAAYLAKYSTKGTEATGHASARITGDTIDLYASPDGTHAQRLIHSCWMLGTADGFMFGKAHGWDSLRRWATCSASAAISSPKDAGIR